MSSCPPMTWICNYIHTTRLITLRHVTWHSIISSSYCLSPVSHSFARMEYLYHLFTFILTEHASISITGESCLFVIKGTWEFHVNIRVLPIPQTIIFHLHVTCPSPSNDMPRDTTPENMDDSNAYDDETRCSTSLDSLRDTFSMGSIEDGVHSDEEFSETELNTTDTEVIWQVEKGLWRTYIS